MKLALETFCRSFCRNGNTFEITDTRFYVSRARKTRVNTRIYHHFFSLSLFLRFFPRDSYISKILSMLSNKIKRTIFRTLHLSRTRNTLLKDEKKISTFIRLRSRTQIDDS